MFTKLDVTTKGNSSMPFFTVFISSNKCQNTDIFGHGVDKFYNCVRFVVLILTTMKITILWGVMPHSPVEVH